MEINAEGQYTKMERALCAAESQKKENMCSVILMVIIGKHKNLIRAQG